MLNAFHIIQPDFEVFHLIWCYILLCIAYIANNSKFHFQDNYGHICKPIFISSRWLAWRLGAEIIATTTPHTAHDLIVDVNVGLTKTKTYKCCYHHLFLYICTISETFVMCFIPIVFAVSVRRFSSNG